MEIFQVLADGTRRRILELLAKGEWNVGDLAAEFEISQPGISRHLRVLREAGAVTSRVDGQRRLYRLEPGSLQALEVWLARRRRDWERRLEALEAHLAKQSRRPRRGDPT